MEMSVVDKQNVLARHYRYLLADPAECEQSAPKLEDRLLAETIADEWISDEIRQIDIEALPAEKHSFLSWYLRQEQKLNRDISPFISFVEEKATIEQIAFYICMEEMIDGSFDDMMAIVQVGMPIECKMVAARNYWDELGNGDFTKVHTTMFRQSSRYLRGVLDEKGVNIESPPIECLMNGNILLSFTFRPEHRLRLIGALGLVEGSAPRRFSATTRAMQRLRLPSEVIAYHKSHISIDTKHSKEWFDTVLNHYAALGGKAVKELALGVAVRYQIALRYYAFMLNSMRNLKRDTK